MSTNPNPFQKQIYGVNFWKNGSSATGAQALAIRDKQEGEILAKSWMKNGQLWGCVTPAHFLKLLETNKGLYEMLTQYPYKVFFDIDNKDTGVNFAEFTQKIKANILGTFPEAEFAISGSFHETKASLHITLNNYLIRNEEDRNILRAIVGNLKLTDSSFDISVYKTNGCIKAINQMKSEDPYKRVQKIIENPDFKAHCITCFFKEDSEILPLPELSEEVKMVAKIDKLKRRFEMTALPKVSLRLPQDVDFSRMTPSDYLALLPISKEPCHNFNYTHRVARFCYSNGIGFDVFWSWIQKKHIEKRIAKETANKPSRPLEEDYKRWAIHIWPKLDQFPPVSVETIHAILSHYYPDFKKDRFFRGFENTFRLEDAVEVEQLEVTQFEVDQKIVVIKASMGAGKTHVTVSYLKKKNDRRILWICPNRALVSNVYTRLQQDGIDIKNYQKYSQDKRKMREEEKLIICLNSMHYLAEMEPELHQAKYDIVVIDEIETLLNKFVDNDFMKIDQKIGVWKQLLRVLNEAQKVILLDAFITTKTISFFKNISGNMILYNCAKAPERREVVFHKQYQKLVMKIMDDLKKGKKLFIFYAYKSNCGKCPSMEGLHAQLEEQTGTKGKYINADKDDKELLELEDVNEHWKDVKFVITNNKITVGVNYDREDFDEEYMFIANYNLPRDIIQVSCRTRFLSTKKINICYVGPMKPSNTWKVDTQIITCPIYSCLVDSILTEFKSPLKQTFQLFCEKAQYRMISDDELIESTLRKEFDQIFENASVGYSYTDIDDINDFEAGVINSKMMNQCATMYEKIKLQKFFFKLKFKRGAEEVVIQVEDEGPINMLQFCWEKRDLFLFKRFKTIITEKESNIFEKIRLFNNLGDTIFIQDIKKLKLSTELVAEIFEIFNFKYLTQKSATVSILKEMYNTYFNKELIRTQKGKDDGETRNHNVTHVFTEFDEYNQKFIFAEKFLKRKDDDELRSMIPVVCMIPDKADEPKVQKVVRAPKVISPEELSKRMEEMKATRKKQKLEYAAAVEKYQTLVLKQQQEDENDKLMLVQYKQFLGPEAALIFEDEVKFTNGSERYHKKFLRWKSGEIDQSMMDTELDRKRKLSVLKSMQEDRAQYDELQKKWKSLKN